MSTPFGPQLVGETEKTLNAVLLAHLDGTGLTEPQWVTLRVASMLGGAVDGDGLAVAVSDRAHFADAAYLVEELTDRGLLAHGALSDAGRELVARVQASIADDTETIFDDIPAEDIAATERVLNEVVTRARAALAR
jgi:hypothetical protein